MNVQYNSQIDEISSDDMRPELYYEGGCYGATPLQRWPKVIGIVQMINGFITAFLGTLEILIMPMAENMQHTGQIHFSKRNCFGTGLLAGILMILTGATAIRASISKRTTTVFRFYNLTMLTLILYMALTLFLIAAYGLGWTTKDNYPEGSKVHEVHIFMTVSTFLGLLFALTAIVKYYDVVCCGEMQLGRKWTNCFCPCFFEKTRSRRRQNSSDSPEDMPI